MRQVAVILCKGTPTSEEVALRDQLVSQGYSARVVSAPPRKVDRRERERCNVAYSFHKDLLDGYSNTELVLPGGVQAASSGFTITRRGRWFYVNDADGNQVNDKGLSEEDATKLMSEL